MQTDEKENKTVFQVIEEGEKKDYVTNANRIDLQKWFAYSNSNEELKEALEDEGFYVIPHSKPIILDFITVHKRLNF